MTSTPSEELLSCPFCGSERIHIHNSAVAPNGDKYVVAWCADCGATSRDAKDAADATAAWNRRSSSRREVLEEAARVADEAQATAREEIALEKAEEGYDPYAFGSGFLSGEITASANIAKAIRALAEEK